MFLIASTIGVCVLMTSFIVLIIRLFKPRIASIITLNDNERLLYIMPPLLYKLEPCSLNHIPNPSRFNAYFTGLSELGFVQPQLFKAQNQQRTYWNLGFIHNILPIAVMVQDVSHYHIKRPITVTFMVKAADDTFVRVSNDQYNAMIIDSQNHLHQFLQTDHLTELFERIKQRLSMVNSAKPFFNQNLKQDFQNLMNIDSEHMWSEKNIVGHTMSQLALKMSVTIDDAKIQYLNHMYKRLSQPVDMDEALSQFRLKSDLGNEQWNELSARLMLVHDHMDDVDVKNAIEKQMPRLAQQLTDIDLITQNAMPARQKFKDLIDSLKEPVGVIKLDEIKHPVGVDLYLAPLE